MFKANFAKSEDGLAPEIEKRLEELNKKRSILNNASRIFAGMRLISGGGSQYTYQREGG